MNFKFTQKSVALAIAAGTNAFGIAYGIAMSTGGTVTGNEWIVITWAVISAAIGALLHDNDVKIASPTVDQLEEILKQLPASKTQIEVK